MATANSFQTRVFNSKITHVTANRIDSLLNRAENSLQSVRQMENEEKLAHRSRQQKLNLWTTKMCERIDQIYVACLADLKQSFDQLKAFQQLMIQILNHDRENYIDAKKLSLIEHEICILRCLTYQLDTSKVKIDGKLRLTKGSNHDPCGNAIGDGDQEMFDREEQDEKKKREILCRILMEKELIRQIEDLPVFESVQMTTKNLPDSTPERVLTIKGPNQLDIIKELVSKISASSSSSHPCELRILLHQSYVPLIVGKLGDRSKMLREKYSLHTLTVHPSCAPHSTERVLLIRSSTIDKILSCLNEIFSNIQENAHDEGEIRLYDELNYDASLAHEYGGFGSEELPLRSSESTHSSSKGKYEDEDDGVRRYSAFDAWNGSVEADIEHEFSVVKMGDDCIKKEFWINHSEFGALLGPHGVRIAQIRSQCRTVRIHTVAGSSIDTCSVQVIGPRADVNHAVALIVQSIKEHDRKFPFKHHRFSGRLR